MGTLLLRNGKPKKPALIIGIFLLPCLLRASGYLVFEYYRGVFRSEAIVVGNINPMTDNNFGTTWGSAKTTTEVQFSNWHLALNIGTFNLPFGKVRTATGVPDKVVCLPLSNGENCDDAVAELIKEKLEKPNMARQFDVALIQRSEKTGLYWFPFVKSGTYTYEILIKNDSSQDKYTMQFKGKIAFQVEGFCRGKELNEQIAAFIVKQVEDRFTIRSR